MNELLKTRHELREQIRNTVTYSHGRRVFDVVVFELVGADALHVRRSIVLLTGLDHDRDRRRVSRLCRRLRTMGFSLLWQALCHPLGGVGGTVRLRRATWRD